MHLCKPLHDKLYKLGNESQTIVLVGWSSFQSLPHQSPSGWPQTLNRGSLEVPECSVIAFLQAPNWTPAPNRPAC